MVGAALLLGGLSLVAVWPRLRVRSLIRDLDDPERRLAATQDLLATGPAAVPALIEVVSDPDHRARVDAIELLGRIGDARALPALLAASDDPGLRRQRLEALGRLRGPEALEAVLLGLKAPELELQLTALAALEDWPDPEGKQVPLLTGYLDDPRPGFKVHAARGLGTRRHAPAVPRLIQLLGHADGLVRDAAGRALVQIGTPEAQAAVEQALASGAVSFEE